jgi:hypothetical protein
MFIILIFLIKIKKKNNINKNKKQPYAVDHLARESMKSAANCVN